MAEYYINGQSGNDSTGSGTSPAPYKTMAKLRAVIALATGDIVNIADRCEESMDCTGMTGVVVRQWVGQTQCNVTAARALASTGWTAVGGGIFSKTLAAGLAINSAVALRSSRMDTRGWYGYYKAVAVAATAFSWAYNSGTGVLLLNTSTDGDPSSIEDGTFEYVLKDVNCMDARGCVSCIFDGIWFGPVSGITGGSGINYGAIGGGNNNIFRSCRFSGGFHGGGFVDSQNSANEFQDCTFYEQAGTSTQGVFYSNGGSVTGAKYTRCTFYPSSYRYPDKTIIDPTIIVDAMYAHTDGSGGHQVASMIARECVATFNSSNEGSFISGGNLPVVTANSVSIGDYPIQAIDCTMIGGNSTGFTGCGYQRFKSLSPKVLPSSKRFFCGEAANRGVSQCLFESCHIVVNLHHATEERSILFMRRVSAADNTTPVIVNSTFIGVMQDAVSGWPRWITFDGGGGAVSDDGQIYARGTAIIGLDPGNASIKGLSLHVNDPNISAAKLNYVGCWWYGWDSGYSLAFSEVANRNTQAEFAGVVDTLAQGAVYGTDPQYTSILASEVPTPGGHISATKYSQSVHASVGINKAPYSRNYGAYQYGGGGVMLMGIRAEVLGLDDGEDDED